MRRSLDAQTAISKDGPLAGRRPRQGFAWVTAVVAGIAAVAAAVAALGGCSTSDADDSAAEDRVYVQGYGVGCTWPEERQIADDNPDIDVWEGVLSCRDEMSDPRVTGDEEWTLVDPYFIHYTTAPQTTRFEASVVLTPDEGEGTWRGEGFGADIFTEQGTIHTVFHGEYLGEGEYEGLVYRIWGSQQPETPRYEIVGYIQPVE